MKILIADDDEFTMELIKRKLNGWGYNDVVCLSNGKEALEYLVERDQPLITILDWMMPEKNGNEVYLELPGNEEFPLFRILLTAKNTTEEMLYGLDCGADRYLTKPIDFQDLKDSLDQGITTLESRES